MARKTATLSIVFADISGSTRLYETLGDGVAREIVAKCLSLMTGCVEKYDGKVIKTIGDEIMCVFPTAEQSVESAMAMQEAVTEDLPPIIPKTATAVTICVGLHHGPVILEGGDVFGDAVNVAARMAAIAKGGQILTTGDTASRLPPVLRSSTRHLDRVSVKGKSSDIELFEVVWQPDDVTRIATGFIANKTTPARLHLSYRGAEVEVTSRTGPVVIGRGRKADLIVNDSMASREHARIEYRRGKYFVVDQSTNGTYVDGDAGAAYLRREETPLAGRGRLALGRALADASEIVEYEVKF